MSHVERAWPTHGRSRVTAAATDRVVPAGVRVFDDGCPAVSKLDSALLRGLRRAATDAGRAGIALYIDSGWRSGAYPERLTAWLSKHGFRFGLCQIYRNEPWHYELRPDADAHGCPAMHTDAAHDPRMQR